MAIKMHKSLTKKFFKRYTSYLVITFVLIRFKYFTLKCLYDNICVFKLNYQISRCFTNIT